MNAFLLYNLSMYDYTVKHYIETFADKSIILHSSDATPDRSAVRHVFNERYIDISYYVLQDVIELLKKHNISSITFFTYQSIYDKFFICIAKNLGIKTIFHDHGILYGSKPGKGSFNINKIKYIYHILRRTIHFKRQSQMLVQSLSAPQKVLFKELINDTYCNLEFDKSLFFCLNNYHVHSTIIKLIKENIVISGLPVLPKNSDISLLQKYVPKGNIVLYIHQPLIKFGFTKLKISEEILYIRNIAKNLKQSNKVLLIRFHPTQDMCKYHEELKSYGIRISENNLLEEDIMQSTIVIGHWSTALLNAFVLNRPIFIITYPKLKSEYTEFNTMFSEISQNGRVYNNINELFHESTFDPISTSVINKIKMKWAGTGNSYESNYSFFLKILNDKL